MISVRHILEVWTSQLENSICSLMVPLDDIIVQPDVGEIRRNVASAQKGKGMDRDSFCS